MIHILCVDISAADADIYRTLYKKASPERQHRSDRYLRQEDRLRCVVSDALLRTALGASHYETEKNQYGKPYVKGHPGFYYNLSHSGPYVVIAWGDSEVGVDVQQHTAADPETIAKRWFAPDEQDYIRSGAEQTLQRFYQIWTGKESYIKYLGLGLRKDLRSFSSLAPEPPIRYLHLPLGDDCSLSLCSTDTEHTFSLLNLQQLLQGDCL